ALVKIILQRGCVLETVFAHERLDARIGLPLDAVIFIASDVHEVVGEDGRHLGDESIEKFIGAFAGRIYPRIEDPERPFDMEGGGSAGEIGIPDEPGTGVSRHVELGHDADAAVARIGNNFAGLLLSIEESVGAHPREFRERSTLDAKTLVFTKMPVEYVKLNGGHPVETAADNVDRHEVASAVNHKTAPAKTRRAGK